MKKLLLLLSILALLLSFYVVGEFDRGRKASIAPSERDEAQFVAIVLGAAGGLTEDNLSSYLLAPRGSTDFIALDAGTLLAGIHQARLQGSFDEIRVPAGSELSLEGWVLQHHIKSYLISHAHLDHVAGLVINSTDDAPKEILGLAGTIDFIQNHLFNWEIWPNFGDSGKAPHLKKYRYVRLEPGVEIPISNSSMTVEPFVLSHSSPYQSTAFLVRSGESYALYFGDTGPDAVEKSDRLRAVWTRVAPLARERKLRGIFLEISFPDGRPDELLFGHLTPSWMMKELKELAAITDPTDPQSTLRGLVVIVTHIKPSLQRGPHPRDQIAHELKAQNSLGIRFIIPTQGQRIEF